MTTAIRSEASRSVVVVNGVDTMAVNQNGSVELLNSPGTPTGNAVARASDILGIGQTWQDLTGSRALNTTYTNTTGKPIQVCFLATSTAAFLPRLSVGGVVIQGPYASSGTFYTGVVAIIPPGATYSASVSTGTGSLYEWRELR